MPKAGSWPVSGLFGLNKPSHVITMSMLNDLKELLSSSPVFVSQPVPISSDAASSNNPNQSLKNAKGKRRGGRYAKPKKESTVKMGQGGTLDPLANGVLVVGIGEGTKQLKNFLDCSKTYRATGLLGCSTDSYDSEGKVVRRAKAKHLKREDVEGVLDRFRGDIQQTPPVYSALKMDGKPLYEYARAGQPLPRPVDARSCTVHSLSLVDWQDAHDWTFPSEAMEAEMVHKLESLVDAPTPDAAATEMAEEEGPGPAFTIEMTVSSGTYVRSIIHDIGLALNSLAHVVVLERSRQGDYALEPASQTLESSDLPKTLKPCADWSVFAKALEQARSGSAEAAEPGESVWEQAILSILESGSSEKPKEEEEEQQQQQEKGPPEAS